MIRRVGRKLKRMLIKPQPPVQKAKEPTKEEIELERLDNILSTGRYTKGKFENDRYHLVFPDPDSFVFMYRELFHNSVYRFHQNRDTPFIIDCGANIGLSVLYFKEVYPTAKIIAFEPDKEVFDYLEQNVRTNAKNVSDIELVNKGLWDQEGKISFKNEGADAGRISFEGDSTEFKKTIEIDTVRLSSYINGPVDFIKLDIEGAEVKVIQELEPKLVYVDNIFIEFHSFINSPQELDLILSILTRNKFRYYIDAPFRLRKNPFTDHNTLLSLDFLVNIYAIKERQADAG